MNRKTLKSKRKPMQVYANLAHHLFIMFLYFLLSYHSTSKEVQYDTNK